MPVIRRIAAPKTLLGFAWRWMIQWWCGPEVVLTIAQVNLFGADQSGR